MPKTRAANALLGSNAAGIGWAVKHVNKGDEVLLFINDEDDHTTQATNG
jgi:hypothetical protein